MKRLVDDPELAPDALRLAELVRQAEPFERNASGKRRVLTRMRERTASGFGVRAPALGVALLVASAAAAAVGYRWVDAGAAPAAISVPAPVPAPRNDPRPPNPPRAVEAAATPEVQATASKTSVATAQPAPQRSRAAPAKPRASAEDPAPVLDAIRALRKSGDPARAQKLLDAYLVANPRGALSEDALGLAIEAAAARRDPRAADYAKRYLALFPNGRFRAVALKAARR
jgi:hypothetical protein